MSKYILPADLALEIHWFEMALADGRLPLAPFSIDDQDFCFAPARWYQLIQSWIKLIPHYPHDDQDPNIPFSLLGDPEFLQVDLARLKNAVNRI